MTSSLFSGVAAARCKLRPGGGSDQSASTVDSKFAVTDDGMQDTKREVNANTQRTSTGVAEGESIASHNVYPNLHDLLSTGRYLAPHFSKMIGM